MRKAVNNPMLHRSQRRKQKGSATIEFSIGFFFFWLMCAFWIQVSMLSYISGIGDLAIAQASLHSKRLANSTEFLADFQRVLADNDSLWSYVVQQDNFRYSIRYLNSFDELSALTDKCEPDTDSDAIGIECGSSEGAAIAVYRIDYNAPKIYDYFIDTETLFSRETIVIQEYQRDQFSLD